MLTAEEVGRHASKKSCWVIIAGQAYDVTDYLNYQPGGANSILRYAGKARFLTHSNHFVLTTGFRMPPLSTHRYIRRVRLRTIFPYTSISVELLELLHLGRLNHLSMHETGQNKLLFLSSRISTSSKLRPTNTFPKRPVSTLVPQQIA